jgi:hypothetical protein
MKSRAFLSLAAFSVLAAVSFAEAPLLRTKLGETLAAAEKENKMAFVLLGRSNCEYCNATKALIREGKVPVTATEFVMADLNYDDAPTQQEFMAKYGEQKFGEMLPYVVVTDAHGKALASSSGGKSAEEWTGLIAKAKQKAKEPAGGGFWSWWPFK